jgi:hypothetical protein
MEDRFWNSIREREEADPEVAEVGAPPRVGALVRINGANLPIEVGSSFRETVVHMAQEAGFGKFRVFMNGEEVKPSASPELITEGTRMEIRPFDPAA